MNRVAADVGDLTPAWLSEALGIEVRTVVSEQIGSGQTGASYRLTLERDTGPSSLVAKLAAGSPSARGRVSSGYRNEVGFYTQLAPTLDVRAPRCSYAALSDDAHDFTLLLEDLAPRVPGVQADGCSVSRAEDAVRNLVRLHAPRWNDDSLFDADFLERSSAERAQFMGEILVPATDEFITRYSADLDAADIETLGASARAITGWLTARPVPFAVVHGDYRLDNLMFHPDGGDVVALDWQTVTVGPPARDLAYFLGTSLETSSRRSAEERLVGVYHDALVARGVRDYARDRCFDDYRLGQLQGPMITVLGCAYATADRSTEADRMFVAMARRSCAAIRDLDSLGAL